MKTSEVFKKLSSILSNPTQKRMLARKIQVDMNFKDDLWSLVNSMKRDSKASSKNSRAYAEFKNMLDDLL